MGGGAATDKGKAGNERREAVLRACAAGRVGVGRGSDRRIARRPRLRRPLLHQRERLPPVLRARGGADRGVVGDRGHRQAPRARLSQQRQGLLPLLALLAWADALAVSDRLG